VLSSNLRFQLNLAFRHVTITRWNSPATCCAWINFDFNLAIPDAVTVGWLIRTGCWETMPAFGRYACVIMSLPALMASESERGQTDLHRLVGLVAFTWHVRVDQAPWCEVQNLGTGSQPAIFGRGAKWLWLVVRNNKTCFWKFRGQLPGCPLPSCGPALGD